MGKKTTFSAGFERSKLRTYLNLLRYFKRNRDFALHDYHNVFCQAKAVMEKHVRTDIENTRILEVGCGQRFAVTLLFHLMGAQAVGIDTDFVDPSFSVRGYLSVWKKNGFERFAKTLFRHILFDRAYYATLEKEFGRPLRTRNVDVRIMNACALDFPDGRFDYVYSNAVFEHIDDVGRACEEVARVLKENGIANIGIHLFPSLSGGHNLEWSSPDEKPATSAPPWDHLRQDLFPAHVYLNKLREKDYLEMFDKRFSIVDTYSRYEGEQYLSEAIKVELSDYSKEDLLKRELRVIMRKK